MKESLRKPVAWLARQVIYSPGLFPALTENRVKNPVFIVGCGRSGTTMLTAAVASHRDVATFYSEANELWHPRSFPWHESDLERPPLWMNPSKFTQLSLQDWTARHRRKVRAIFGAYQSICGKEYFLNKSAMITFMVPHILGLFPEARFVHIHRDGRAVAYSYALHEHPKLQGWPLAFKKAGYYFPFEGLLEKCAECWREHILESERQRKAFEREHRPVMLDIGYEDFCADPKAGLRRIADFLGLAPDGFRMKDYSRIKNRNYKYQEKLAPALIEGLTKIMEPALRLKGYL